MKIIPPSPIFIPGDVVEVLPSEYNNQPWIGLYKVPGYPNQELVQATMNDPSEKAKALNEQLVHTGACKQLGLVVATHWQVPEMRWYFLLSFSPGGGIGWTRAHTRLRKVTSS